MLAQLSIKTDPKLKKAAQIKAEEQGLPLTIVINSFLRGYVADEFELTLIKKQQKDDSQVTMEELFRSKKIVKKANLLSDYLSKKDL